MHFPPPPVIIEKLFLNSSIRIFATLLAFIGVFAILGGLAIGLAFTQAGLGLVVGAACAAILVTQIIIFRHLFHYHRDSYQQIEALFSLHATIKIDHPLPPMRDWAISPDLAVLIASLIQEHQPRVIVEASSGVSTLISAYCLRANGGGRVISLDQDERFAHESRRNVSFHRLNDLASVIQAPLRPYNIKGKEWLWYELSALADVQLIDMLIVDGPPHSTQKMARYPALPLLIEKLSDRAVIVLDDGWRPDERQIVQMWCQEFPDFELERVLTEKISYILRRKTASRPQV